MSTLISIIVPCYNEEKALPLFYEEICRVADAMNEKFGVSFQFLFIDDGSSDATVSIMKQLRVKDPRVDYVVFSRNFGKEAAMYAGLENAHGDYVAVIDADMQHPPTMLLDMYQKLLTGDCDCAAARRVSRKGEPPIRSFFARAFYKVVNRISATEIVDGACDFRLMTRKMADAILSMPEYNRFSKGIFSWVGFRTSWLEYVNVERVAGETKWSFGKLFLYSIEGLVAFSTAPMRISALIGILFCLFSLIGVIFIVVKTAAFGDPVSGWPSMVCLFLLLSGVQLFCIGILGEYLAKTYMETKHRPIYIAKDSTLSKKNEKETIQ